MYIEQLLNELIGAALIVTYYFAYNAGRKEALKQHNIQGD